MISAHALARCVSLPLLAALLSACAARIPLGTQYHPASQAHEVVVDVPFVTNRALRPTRAAGNYYSDVRGELAAGHCQVAFEENDTRGQVLRVDADSMDGVLRAGSGEPFVIYIHGYGESFAKNCRRAALLQHRLELSGRFLLFSWPASNYLTYGGDVGDMRASVEQLNELLSLAAETIGGQRLVILAHSLGTRGIVEALARRDDGSPTFGKVVLIASDLRRKAFLERAQMLQQKAADVTVYMSDKDRVLMLSAAINASGRLGLAKEFDIDTERMHFVDVTAAASSDMTGHLYHLFSPAVTEDLRHLLGSEVPGIEREYRRIASREPGFWKLEADSD
jgi:pimeloyl-ACP methyl ester carboxylesterase